MDMTEPISSWGLIFNAAKAGGAIIDDKKRMELTKKLLLLVRKKRKIVIFGISGAGKSQFINSLKRNIIVAERTFMTDRVKHELEDFPIEFIDTPGQNGRTYERQQEINNIIKDGVEGIINVSSFGYEENPEIPLANIFTPKGEVKDSHLRLNRKEELKRLAEWLPLIQPANIGWIINLINKGDLWWSEISEVDKYYGEGDYFKAFESITKYTHILNLPYCSIIKPYYNMSTCGKFGDIQKEQMHNHLIHQLLNLLKED